MEVLIIIISLLILGTYRKDFTTLVFAGIGFIVYGLMILNGFVPSLVSPYNFQVGIICICYGFYVSFRSSLDLITYKKEVKKDA